MDISPLLHAGAPVAPQTAPMMQPPPQITADLRPVADAAALAHDPRPASASTSILPAPLAQLAEVSRSLVASTADEGPLATQRAERVLKPWGVTMLPALDDDSPHPSGPGHESDRESDRIGQLIEGEAED